MDTIKCAVHFGYYVLQDWTPFPAVLFAPVVEGASNSSFLTAQPQTLYAMNQVSKVPWITSSTSQEGYVILLCKCVRMRSIIN